MNVKVFGSGWVHFILGKDGEHSRSDPPGRSYSTPHGGRDARDPRGILAPCGEKGGCPAHPHPLRGRGGI